jgi:predicted MFS family arabinose efflux permease
VQGGSRGGARLTVDARRILAVQALRAFVYGLGSVALGLMMEGAGYSGIEVGLLLAALVGGVALVSVMLGRYGDRVGRRRCYLGLLVLMGLAGTVFALTTWLPALLLAALSGAVSPDVVESGPFTSLEQAMLPHAAGTRSVTALFADYNVVATVAGSLGALAAGGPVLLDQWIPSLPSSQELLFAYPLAAAAGLIVARRLSPDVEAGLELQKQPVPPLHRSRGIVYRLCAVFAVDSFGGGFVVQTFIAYLFAQRYGASQETIALLFFSAGLLQALSFYIAVRLARRIGLLRTMVFTHLPANVLLAAVAFAPTLTIAIALLLGRFVLSQMDVPTRQAYVIAVVDPTERTAASAYTNTARYASRPFASLLAGPFAAVWLGAPFLIAGGLKATYDIGLWVMFRHVELRSDTTSPARST